MDFKIFGWQGIELDIPQDWELAEEKGHYARGYVRLDDAVDPRVRVSWMHAEKMKAKDPPYEAAKKVKKELKKKDKAVKFIREARNQICTHPARYLHWRGSRDRAELEGCGFFWHCPQTMRGFSVVFAFRTEEYWNLRSAINRAVESITCHSNTLRKWTALGVDLSIPQDFRLVEREYDMRRLHLLFSSEGAFFMIDRLNFAQLITNMKHENLEDWFERKYKRKLERRFKCSQSTEIKGATFNGHEGILTRASSKRSLIGRRFLISESHVWHCRDTDKIFALTAVKENGSNPKVEEDLETMLESVKCHV